MVRVAGSMRDTTDECLFRVRVCYHVRTSGCGVSAESSLAVRSSLGRGLIGRRHRAISISLFQPRHLVRHLVPWAFPYLAQVRDCAPPVFSLPPTSGRARLPLG